jgi:sugar-phosphatase
MIEFVVAAVLFDLDGTLIDSTTHVDRSWAYMATRLGIPESDVVGRFHGVPARDVLHRLDPGLTEEELDKLHAEHVAFEIADAAGVAPTPGAAALLAGLPDDRWAVVTSCPLDLAVARIRAAGLPFPGELVTREQTVAGKPDPEPYLLGARRIGYPPDHCLVIEDAPVGVEAGRAAGCAVLGVLTTHERLDVPAAPDLRAVVATVDGEVLRVSARPPG